MTDDHKKHLLTATLELLRCWFPRLSGERFRCLMLELQKEARALAENETPDAAENEGTPWLS